MKVVTYNSSFRQVWDDFVRSSRNGTFLFCREFMDYHADRFTDASLLFYSEKGQLLGLLPASIHEEQCEIRCHGGLTYGAFVLGSKTHLTDVGEMLELATTHYKSLHCNALIIKPIPYIYESSPSDDILYWFYRKEAQLISCGVSSAVNLTEPLPFSTLRKRKVNEALRVGYEIINVSQSIIDSTALWTEFWHILEDVLKERHNQKTVHTLEEILLLQSRFPEEINLFVTKDKTGKVVAGSVLFITQNVVHAQYIAASDEGRENGALDLLFSQLIQQYKGSNKRYFDFGISTEDGGKILNEGLNFQKEGFGARSVVYSAYYLSL